MRRHQPSKLKKADMTSIGARTKADVMRIASNPKMSAHVRGQACSILGRNKELGGVRTLLEICLNETDEIVAWAAASALSVSRNTRIVGPLITILTGSQRASIKQRAAYILRFAGSERVRKSFEQILSDGTEDDRTRGFAAEGLGSLCPRISTIRILVAGLYDKSIYIRVSALCGLSSISSSFAHTPGASNTAARKAFENEAIPVILDCTTDNAAIPGEYSVGSLARSILREYKSIPRMS